MANESPHVLLTGANGYIATQLIADLLERGYRVTGSVRTPAKAQVILDRHPSWKSKVDFVSVADVAADGAFEGVFRERAGEGGNGFDYVVHAASSINFYATDFQKELIDPTIAGVIGLLECCSNYGGERLKRFILMGSTSAIENTLRDESKPVEKPYSEEDWNPTTPAVAIASKSGGLGYVVSKIESERAAWAWMAAKKPKFDFVVLNPDIVLGPVLQANPDPKSFYGTVMYFVYNFLRGTFKEIEGLKFTFYQFVDVRDVSLATILAFTRPAAANKRIILVAGLLTPQLVINAIRKNFPELHSRVIEGNPTEIIPKGVVPCEWDTSRSYEVFGEDWKYTDLETSVCASVRSCLELEKGWKEKGLI
ncbi:MAG: hypothetical protein M1824_000922 [Vezdaea acicularis]|nr:MAG: hypothetical protein M1824_000922 [Vezdaea acicularis]